MLGRAVIQLVCAKWVKRVLCTAWRRLPEARRHCSAVLCHPGCESILSSIAKSKPAKSATLLQALQNLWRNLLKHLRRELRKELLDHLWRHLSPYADQEEAYGAFGNQGR